MFFKCTVVDICEDTGWGECFTVGVFMLYATDATHDRITYPMKKYSGCDHALHTMIFVVAVL